MILVFGGTTEGRRAAEVLEEAGTIFYYSTKTGEQDITLHHGERTDGAMDCNAMRRFSREHRIRLIVDAAHPFASQLHTTIAAVAAELQIPVVRYERIYPPRVTEVPEPSEVPEPPEFPPSPEAPEASQNASITWIDDYSQVPTDITTLLATTGVQSISRLKWLEAAGVKVIYRILNRESSIALAHQQGATDDQLCFYPFSPLPPQPSSLNSHPSTLTPQPSSLNSHPSTLPPQPSPLFFVHCPGCEPAAAPPQPSIPDAILMKESGLSGGFAEKVAEARKNGMRIIVIKRPQLPFKNIVNGPHGLRRAVEHLLPEFFPLHSGLTTGTCATAAAVAATIRLTKGETPAEVPVMLPNGETIIVPVGYADGYAYCIKEAGDDPDITDGIEIRASVSQSETILPSSRERLRVGASAGMEGQGWWRIPIQIFGGEGVGTITLPGFDYPPGSPAINKAPREMIRKNISSLPPQLSPLIVTISVPHGAEIAKKTFNPRLGIEGGISIIGVSGIVKPFSEEAFIDSIRKCMMVAKASGTDRVVINSGGKSERFVKALYPDLPHQAFVEYGNYVGETLKIAHELGIRYVTLGVMLGKAVKLAAGNLDTHSRKTVMDKAFISQMLCEANTPLLIDLSHITLARELWEHIPTHRLEAFAHIVIAHCYEYCQPLLPNGELTILLIDDNGKIYGNSKL